VTHLYLVRHGETDWNAARRVQGSTDIPLNDTGRAQARRTGRLLSSRRWDAIVASPLSRALETAEIIADEIDLPSPLTLDALVERHYGEAEGLDYTTIDARFPGGAPVPGREERESVARRVFAALIGLAEDRPGQRLIVVTHGGVIRTVLNSVASEQPRFFGIPITNGSVHSFACAEGALALMAFDDQIELDSVDPVAADFIEQNAVAARDEVGGA